MHKSVVKAGTLAIFVLSLAVLLAIFELRYIWYVDLPDLWILRGGFAVGLLILVTLFVSRAPSAFTGVVGLATLFFPCVHTDYRLQISMQFAVFVAVAISLLISANEIRRRTPE